RPLKPAYVPIDESHPTCAHDAYGLSKLLAEQVCRAYHHETGVTTVCLRPPWVWIPEETEQCKALTEDPASWAHSLWAYVIVGDLCSAVRDAMTAPLPEGFFTFFTAAPDNGTRLPSRVLLETYYGFRGPYRDGFGEYDSVISSATARALLKWEPRLNWKDWLAALLPDRPATPRA
ncbi:MAG: NAD(P)-dependent oxidoreductase, partial [Bacillota bacterium]